MADRTAGWLQWVSLSYCVDLICHNLWFEERLCFLYCDPPVYVGALFVFITV